MTPPGVFIWRATSSDVLSPAEAGFAKAASRYPLFGRMR
jgi:hypothetical protein